MSENSLLLGLPYIQGAQAQKHVTHNEAIRALDTLVQLAVADDNRTTPPASPADGDRHIVAIGATDDWAGQDNAIAQYEGGAWVFVPPFEGLRTWVADQSTLAAYSGGAWVKPLQAISQVAEFGVNATPDAATPFVAKVPNALWQGVPTGEGGTGSVIQSMSRIGATTDAGLAFQTDFVTQGLFGFFGGSDLRLSTSADGTSFQDALQIDPATGIAAQPQRPRFVGSTNFDNALATGTWVKVAINTLDANDQAAFDAATNVFTAPISGTYMFGGHIHFREDSSTDVGLQTRFVKNGTDEISGSFGEATGPQVEDATFVATQMLVPLNAGDTIELQARAQRNAAFAAATDTTFWGYLIP